ncbi:MAG TPA: hypothetical protein VF463_06740 [Sphingobium sp.]
MTFYDRPGTFGRSGAAILGASVEYLQRDGKTGRLSYRRIFPAELRPFIPAPNVELKRTLGAKTLRAAGAEDRYRAAAELYDRIVAKAERLATGTPNSFDELNEELIGYLAGTYLTSEIVAQEKHNWGLPAPKALYESRADTEQDYIDCREMLEAYDSEGLVEFWRDWALTYARSLGFTLNPSADAFPTLCKSLGEAAVNLWLHLDAMRDGRAKVTPKAPEMPNANKSEPKHNAACTSDDGTTYRVLVKGKEVKVSLGKLYLYKEINATFYDNARKAAEAVSGCPVRQTGTFRQITYFLTECP